MFIYPVKFFLLALSFSLSLVCAFPNAPAIDEIEAAGRGPSGEEPETFTSRGWITQERLLLLDTETTGLAGHDRIVELGILEVIQGKATGRYFHSYFNPEVASLGHSFKSHKLSLAFLEYKPKFSEKATEICNFIGSGAVLVAHNASFDIRMMTQEMKRLRPDARPTKPCDFYVKDTLAMARRDAKRLEGKVIKSPHPPTVDLIARLGLVPSTDGTREKTKKSMVAMPAEQAQKKVDREWQREWRLGQKMRARKRLFREDADLDQGPSAPPAKRQRTQAQKSFRLVDCVRAVNTTPAGAYATQGIDLGELEKQCGVPENLRGQYHGTLVDNGAVLGLLDRMHALAQQG